MSDVIIRRLPIRWQARWWAWRSETKIHAIRNLRRTALLTLKDAKTMLDPFYDATMPVCPTCGRAKEQPHDCTGGSDG